MSQSTRVWLTQSIQSNLVWKSIASSCTVASILGFSLLSSASAVEVDPQVSKALGYKPRQANVVFDQVSEADIEKCTSKYEKKSGVDGLTVLSPDGQVLRRFNDVNGDRQVDQWCYFRDGIEVYRDIDSDFNNTADQYRWLGTAGTRWGVDKNEDGTIDSWKNISPEEVTIELVEAIKTKDDARFRRLLLSDAEIKELGLGEEKTRQLKERVETSRSGFAEFIGGQKLISSATKWAHFAADKPGVVPAGTDGAIQDIIAYENVISIVDNEGTSQQLMVGTLVQLGTTWKLTDLPKTVSEGAVLAESGFFFPSAAGAANRNAAAGGGNGGMNGEMQTLLADLEKIDTQIRGGSATGDKLATLHEERAQIMVSLINIAKGTEEMDLWVHQFVDSVSSASMQGEYPGGFDRLKTFEAQLPNLPGGKAIMPYVAYRVLTTDYQVKSMSGGANFARLQEDYMESVEDFVKRYPDSQESGDAMIQLALNKELSGDADGAKAWYEKAAAAFPDSNEGKKASGAIARMSLEGRSFGLSGKTLDDKTVDTKKFQGVPVVIHYWASWAEPCKQDMKRIRDELAKNPRGFQVVGVNLDSERDPAIQAIGGGLAPWAHIHEGKGFESDLAVGLGVFSVPITILIDSKGKVVKSGAGFSQDIVEALNEMSEGTPAARNAQLPVTAPANPPAASNRPAAGATPQRPAPQRPAPNPNNRTNSGNQTNSAGRPPQRPIK